MELTDLTFEYSMGAGRFCHFYRFNILSNVDSIDESIKIAKSSLENLERSIYKYFIGEKPLKTKEITNDEIKFGHDYRCSNPRLVNLSYKISIDHNNKKDITLHLTTIGHDQSRILDIFDSIMGLPNLKILGKAKIQADLINFLRKNDFESR